MLAPPELLVLGEQQKGLGGIRLAPVARLAELLEVRAVAVTVVVPLEQLARDEPVLDLDSPRPLDRVVPVVDLPAPVHPRAALAPELHDNPVSVRQLQLDLDDTVRGPARRVAQEGLEALLRDASALVLF